MSDSTAVPSSSNHTPDVLLSCTPLVGLPFPRCTQCSSRQVPGSRNIVVCIDGTSNYLGQNNTNVGKLFEKINLETGLPQPKQFAHYSPGIGARPRPFHVFSRMKRAISDKFDMAIAWNVEEVVKDAYGWLARTYQEGDQIYLFGFSRGAYQVRVLAGMIYEVGLIKTPTRKQIGTAWDHYSTISSGNPKPKQGMKEFKETFSWKDTRVHFIGVWDTVSSVGLSRGDAFPSVSASAGHACHFRHALALDELRVKFMPQYFQEMNSQTGDRKSKYIVTPDVKPATSPTGDRSESTVNENDTTESKKRTGEIKEVWFAGTHSDVGGKNRPGKSQQAGNVSLLWMRREAAASGLVLKPTDIVWVPDDLNFGISDPMTATWRAIEYIPIKHQVSFSGGGEDARLPHKLQPRRIIPGQKVHASVLYANAYKPEATLGEGFDIPIVHCGLDDLPRFSQLRHWFTKMDAEIWETELFDDTAAQELLMYLSKQQGAAPIYLDRLLFMLRFKEGRQCVRNVGQWQDKFMTLIHDREYPPLVRLVATVAYYETSHNPETHPKSPAPAYIELPQETFDDVKQYLSDILAAPKNRDGSRVFALLRPLTKHQILRERILTTDVLDNLVNVLDVIVKQPKGNFGKAMDGLNCLLQNEDTRQTLVEKLGVNPEGSRVSRLSLILEVNDPHLLTTALRMVLTLAKVPEQRARAVCSIVKPRIRELTSKRERLVGLLAVEILLALYNPEDRDHQLDIRDIHVRANLTSVLVCSNPDKHYPADAGGGNTDPKQQILCHLFGLGARELADPQKELIRELKKAVQKGNAQERTAATLTLLKLCETPAIRTYLCGIGLLDVLISQLRRKDSTLLAAYALATCLDHSDLKDTIRDNEEFPKNIVGMLRLDYFDDAVGPVEGFQIFGDLMQHAYLRVQISKYNIAEILCTKLGKGKLKEIRTSLICLNIFRSFDVNNSWTNELVERSLEFLRNRAWKIQKAGITILYALAQTEHGVAAISPRIHEIVEMLLPAGYLPITSQPTPASSNSSNQDQPQSDESTEPQSSTLPNAATTSPSWMLGPACALRILAQNETLRNRTRETQQYRSLRHLYLSGILVDEADTSSWRVRTPNRADVINMLDKMVKAVDEGLSEEGFMSIGGDVLPHIRHWNRLVTLLRTRTVGAITILPGLLGISVLTLLTVVVVTPIYVSSRVYEFFKQAVVRYQNMRILDRLREWPNDNGSVLPSKDGNTASKCIDAGESPSGVHGGETS